MTKKKDVKKGARKAAKKAANESARMRTARKRTSAGLGSLTYDMSLANYVTYCRLAGSHVDVYLDDSDGLVEVAELERIARATIAAWPALHVEFCRIAWEEIVASKRQPATTVPALELSDVAPFSLSVVAQREEAPYWSFGLDVPSLHGRDEYFVICRASDGKWTLAEVRSADPTEEV